METGAALLVGGYRTVSPDTPQVANTMFLFLPNGDWQYHDKVQLVPLGEYVPYREWLPFLRIFGVVESDLYAGNSLQPLQAGDLRIGAVICMESTYPWIARGLANAGANLLAVGSNESWFGRTAALEQHLAFCVLRAIETRRWVVRCAPEGVSAFIAPTGAIRARAPTVCRSRAGRARSSPHDPDPLHALGGLGSRRGSRAGIGSPLAKAGGRIGY
jgi:apolipoprotein N-acyltransferase